MGFGLLALISGWEGPLRLKWRDYSVSGAAAFVMLSLGNILWLTGDRLS